MKNTHFLYAREERIIPEEVEINAINRVYSNGFRMCSISTVSSTSDKNSKSETEIIMANPVNITATRDPETVVPNSINVDIPSLVKYL
jgi:hypothetical protein